MRAAPGAGCLQERLQSLPHRPVRPPPPGRSHPPGRGLQPPPADRRLGHQPPPAPLPRHGRHRAGVTRLFPQPGARKPPLKGSAGLGGTPAPPLLPSPPATGPALTGAARLRTALSHSHTHARAAGCPGTPTAAEPARRHAARQAASPIGCRPSGLPPSRIQNGRAQRPGAL